MSSELVDCPSSIEHVGSKLSILIILQTPSLLQTRVSKSKLKAPRVPLHVTCPQTSRQTFVKSFWEACNKAVSRKKNWSTALPKWVNHMRWIINSCLSTKRLPWAFLILFGFLKKFDLLQTTFPPASILRRRPWRPSHRAGDGVTRMCKFCGPG